MFAGSDPEHLLGMISQRQEEMRVAAREEAEVRRARPLRGARLAAFRLWRLHVMVWFEDARRA
ncbi:MAG TPA: hypothetical protein VFJ72_15595 [Rubrobacteraceae bacterium]|nr:hypothetical protein [Rubrobacteraceae bacterium]